MPRPNASPGERRPGAGEDDPLAPENRNAAGIVAGHMAGLAAQPVPEWLNAGPWRGQDARGLPEAPEEADDRIRRDRARQEAKDAEHRRLKEQAVGPPPEFLQAIKNIGRAP